MPEFKKATKKQSKLRCAIFGPAGSGKTWTSLEIAKGLGGSVAVIDTERGSASKYSDRFGFDVCEPDETNIEGYVAAIDVAGQVGYGVLVIDSLSHGWHELLQEIDLLAKSKYRGNTWSAWSDGTPKQRRLVDAILRYPGHVIATMRSKTEWAQEETSNGKKKPVRVGLAPEQGKGIEYEFDLLLEIDTNHIATVIKDRTGKFQDDLLEKPDHRFGEKLAEWLNDGEAIKFASEGQIKTIDSLVAETGADVEKFKTYVQTTFRAGRTDQLTEEQADAVLAMLKAKQSQMETD